jgi:hypothetical protein
MRELAAALLMSAAALPAAAQDYSATTAAAKHGNGYEPSAIVAGWEREESFTVIAIAPNGDRKTGAAIAGDWKATVTTGPRAEADDDNEEDERYLDKLKTNPPKRDRGPPVPRTQATYFSLTCPAITARMQALKPLTTFEFNPPTLAGNEDGPNGDGREGFDLWIRAGDAELSRAAETENSKLAAWFKDTTKALAACPKG